MTTHLYTYAVRTRTSGKYYDEIDVYASTQAEADRLARNEADEFYGRRSTLERLTAGGSGGLVVVLKN